MKYHIVGNGESIGDILNGYDLSFDELKNENKHIRIWNKLIPGTKLKIPILSESLLEDINEIEPFIEDYYPKIKIEEQNYQVIDDDEEDNIVVEDNIANDNTKDLIDDPFEFIIEPIEKQEEVLNNKLYERTNENGINEHINNNEHNTIKTITPVHLRYVYLSPYYQRPIIYVIRRK